MYTPFSRFVPRNFPYREPSFNNRADNWSCRETVSIRRTIEPRNDYPCNYRAMEEDGTNAVGEIFAIEARLYVSPTDDKNVNIIENHPATHARAILRIDSCRRFSLFVRDNDFATCRVSTRSVAPMYDQNGRQIALNRLRVLIKKYIDRTCHGCASFICFRFNRETRISDS